MLSDRPYMRGDYEREKTSVLTWLLAALVAGFFIQLILDSRWIGGAGRIEQTMALSVQAITEGRVWTLVTHAFLHSQVFPLHVVFNVLALYFLGRELLPMLRPRRFIGVCVAATLVGGLAWTATHWNATSSDTLLGASAAVYALFTIFACFFPNQQVTFLLFFIFPVTLRPKHIAYFLLGFALLGMAVYEVPDVSFPFGMVVASSAHLGGMIVGYLYFRFVHDAHWANSSLDRAEMELPRWLKRARKAPASASLAHPVSLDPAPATRDRDSIRAEVDRILDKINSHGFGALTAEEKRLLDDAKDSLSRR